jgi:hypothetical protein
MYHFKELWILPFCVCAFCLMITTNTNNFLDHRLSIIFIMQVYCVLCEVRTQILYTIEIEFRLQTLPLLRQLVSGLSSRIPVIDLRSFHVGFVVEKMTVGQVFLWVLRYYPVIIILPTLHTHLPSTHHLPEGQEDKESAPSNKSAFSYIGERCIEKYIHFLSFFKKLRVYRNGNNSLSS